jgi:transposase
MAIIKLSSRDVLRLENFLTTRPDARQLKRALALLWLASDESVEEVSNRLRVTRQTVYNWVERFEMRADLPLEQRLADGFRMGRPPTALEIIDPLIDKVIDQDPRKLGYPSTIWTAPLLRQYLADKHQIEVSTKSVSLAIDWLRITWKRPRHRLALRAKNWRLAKGGSKRASGLTSERSY